MAFVWKKELHSGRSFEASEKGVVTYERAWRILTDDKADDQLFVANNSGLPLLYSVYPGDPRAKLFPLSVRPDGDESGLLWIATARYTSKTDEQQSASPLERPAQWTGGMAQFTRPVTRDRFNTPILNYAGDPYDPPPEIEEDRISLIAVRNEAYIPFDKIRQYKNATNSDEWCGAEPRTLKVRITFGELQEENGYKFYPVQYEFAYNPDKWDLTLLEIGYNGVSSAVLGGKKVKLGDEPQLLKRIAAGGSSDDFFSVGVEKEASQANFTAWRVRPEVPFSNLGLTIPT